MGFQSLDCPAPLLVCVCACVCWGSLQVLADNPVEGANVEEGQQTHSTHQEHLHKQQHKGREGVSHSTTCQCTYCGSTCCSPSVRLCTGLNPAVTAPRRTPSNP